MLKNKVLRGGILKEDITVEEIAQIIFEFGEYLDVLIDKTGLLPPLRRPFEQCKKFARAIHSLIGGKVR